MPIKINTAPNPIWISEAQVLINSAPKQIQKHERTKETMFLLLIVSSKEIKINDIIPNHSYTWNQEWNFIELHPKMPFHIFKISK